MDTTGKKVDSDVPNDLRSMAQFDAVLALRLGIEAHQAEATSVPEWHRANADRFFKLFLGSDARRTSVMRTLGGFYSYVTSVSDEWPARGFDDSWEALLGDLRGGSAPDVWGLREYVAWASLGAYRWNPYECQPTCLIPGGWEAREQICEMIRGLFVNTTVETYPMFPSPHFNNNDRIRVGHVEMFRGPEEHLRVHCGLPMSQMIEQTAGGMSVANSMVKPSMCATFALAPRDWKDDPVFASYCTTLKLPPVPRDGFDPAGQVAGRRLLGQRSCVLQLLCYLIENLIKVHALDDVAIDPGELEDMSRHGFNRCVGDICEPPYTGHFHNMQHYLGICRTVAIAMAINKFYLSSRAWDPMSLLEIQPHLAVTKDVLTYVDDLYHRAVTLCIV